jgi:hypothetical protein
MKDLYKNPILYYIAAPIAVAVWPLLVWGIYLPAARKDVDQQIAQQERAKVVMTKIVTLDPERLEIADANAVTAKFTYDGAVDWTANICKIPPTAYSNSTSMPIETRKQNTQSAKVDLKQVDIVRFAKFLSLIQLRWPNLQCERVALTKKQGPPDNDAWDVGIEFKYYY